MFLANSVCASDNGHGLTPAKQLRSRDPGLLCYCLGLVADLGTVNRHTVTFALGLSDYVPLNTTKPLAGLPPGQTPRAFYLPISGGRRSGGPACVRTGPPSPHECAPNGKRALPREQHAAGSLKEISTATWDESAWLMVTGWEGLRSVRTGVSLVRSDMLLLRRRARKVKSGRLNQGRRRS
jgi:hypothetical protein